jgi:hypothetical protein
MDSQKELERDSSIFSGQETPDQKLDAAWKALTEQGRARVGRPRKGSKAPTIAQLGLKKWDVRRARALAAAKLTDEQLHELTLRRPGCSVTALVERNTRRDRRRNPLFRAWRTALKAERQEFVEALVQMSFFAEREDALNEPAEELETAQASPVEGDAA